MEERPPLTAKQLAVLKWIADGCPDDVWPDHTHKLSLRLLELRGLAARRAGARWSAVVLPGGKHYLEHGTYAPRAVPTGRGTASRGRPHSSPGADGDSEPISRRLATRGAARAPDPDRAPDLLRTQIRKPDPALRELLDHRKRVPMAAEHRRRVHLISHSLIEEAKRRGWAVTAVTSEVRQRWPTGQERWWRSNDLFRLDAREQPIGLQFRLRTTRQPHAETAEEARRRAQGLDVGAPRYDYVASDLLRVFLYQETHSIASWEDGARKRIEDRLEEILARIARATTDALEARERARLRAIEERHRIEELQRQQERVAHFDRWVEALEELRERLDRHDAMRAALAALETKPGNEPSCAFISWAGAYLAEADSRRGHGLPEEPAPDMTYAEWTAWKARLARPRY